MLDDRAQIATQAVNEYTRIGTRLYSQLQLKMFNQGELCRKTVSTPQEVICSLP